MESVQHKKQDPGVRPSGPVVSSSYEEMIRHELQKLVDGEGMKELEYYAKLKAIAIWGRVFHADATDLLQTSIEKTLLGHPESYRFKPGEDLKMHLGNCVRRLASNYLQVANFRNKATKDLEYAGQVADKRNEHIDAEFRLTLKNLARGLKGHRVAESVFALLQEGRLPREIRSHLDISELAYDAAIHRIKRLLIRAGSRPNVQEYQPTEQVNSSRAIRQPLRLRGQLHE